MTNAFQFVLCNTLNKLQPWYQQVIDQLIGEMSTAQACKVILIFSSLLPLQQVFQCFNLLTIAHPRQRISFMHTLLPHLGKYKRGGQILTWSSIRRFEGEVWSRPKVYRVIAILSTCSLYNHCRLPLKLPVKKNTLYYMAFLAHF